MSKRLLQLMNQVVLAEGPMGKLRLAMAIGRSEQMIERYLRGACVLSSDKAYKIALACGCTHKEALKLCGEHSNEKAKAG